MKRCPECRRDYYDDTLLYCLDDGNALLEGPASADQPATAILSEPPAVAGGLTRPSETPSESPTRSLIHTTDQTAIFPRRAEAGPHRNLGELTEMPSLSANRAAEPQRKRNKLLVIFGIGVLFLVGGFFGYIYFSPAKQIESIAVMPFVNESGNADVEYLSDGMTETLISSLSQLPNLNVKARSSVFRGWQGYLRAIMKHRSDLLAYSRARFHTALGEKEKAIDELNKAYENREALLIRLKTDPGLDPLRDDPRFQELLRKVGFPQ